jgi:hypothetical protein
VDESSPRKKEAPRKANADGRAGSVGIHTTIFKGPFSWVTFFSNPCSLADRSCQLVRQYSVTVNHARQLLLSRPAMLRLELMDRFNESPLFGRSRRLTFPYSLPVKLMATAAMPHCCQVALGCLTIDFRLRATDLCHPYMYGIPFFFLLVMITGVLVGSLSIAPDFPQKRKRASLGFRQACVPAWFMATSTKGIKQAEPVINR